MHRVFIGYDPRQPIAYNVLQHSIIANASRPVSITPLVLKQLPIKRRGLTEFTFSRFLVPWLCGYEGAAVFLDADMVVKGDICELFGMVDNTAELSVCQMQPRFEWSSAMLFNNEKCQVLTPEFIEDKNQNPLELKWAKKIGEFPAEWNSCVGYRTFADAKLYHFTAGIPVWAETQIHPQHDPVWFEAFEVANHTVGYQELMGRSVHDQAIVRKAC